ncbi:hypothetical protein [Marinobacter halotolerans]|uniref:hypothetical protein n=1 Tax=Marinobacter halotolerans TaxID=1569211 RepID=UPI001243B2C1|nr:hypothetical protein [Marinobacter halotolerans]
MKKLMLSAVVATSVGISGCASIISDSNYPVTINSSPDGASFKVVNIDNGMAVMKGETPATISLGASSGFFSRATYSVEFDKPGYDSQSFVLESSVDGWYFANILFGGLIGLLIVDPATGAMWKLDDTMLISLSKKEVKEGDDTLSIMTLDQVPMELRDEMVPLN